MTAAHATIGERAGPRIGLLGEIGTAATALYYDLLVRGRLQRHGRTPEIVINSLAFEWFTWLEDRDSEGYVAAIRGALGMLVAGGASVLAMEANSPYVVCAEVAESGEVRGRPVIHIVESVAQAGERVGVTRALLLGIPVTMRSALYPERLSRVGIEVQVPDLRLHPRIRGIVFDELTHGIQSAASRNWLLGLVGEHEVNALILGCTELSLLIAADQAPVRLLDSTRLHVADILKAAYSSNGEGS